MSSEEPAGTGKVVEVQAALTAEAAMSVKVVVRGYMSTQHLYAARYAADEAESLERH